MSIGRWLKGATRIRFDDRTLSNLVKNAAVAGGTALGGVGGLAVAGLGSAAGRGLAKGANFGNVLNSGLTGAATADALNSGAGLLKNAVGRVGGSAAGSAGGGALDAIASGPIPGVSTIGGPALPATAGAANAVAPVAPVGGGLLSKALGFAKDNPTAVGMGLQAAGGLATAGSENRMNDAQADILEQRANETRFDFEQRKRRDAELAPLWGALGTGVAGGYGKAAPNPYWPAGG